MSLRSTIWAPSAVLLSVTFPIALVVVARLLMPRSPQPLSAFPEANNLAAPAPESALPEPSSESTGFAGWAERSRVMTGILVVAMVAWLYHHFVTKQAGLDLNAMNTMLLLLCFLLHRNVASFSRAMQGAVLTCWPILVLYQLYGGVAGLLQYTSVGETFAGLFATVSTHLTFPLMTAIAATVVAVFVPSSGGQWVIQGFVTTKAAAAVGLTAQRGLLALSVGDQMGNLVSPFWPVLAAGIARVDFRKFFGYGLVFAALWFVMGVLIFTLVP
jgi:short-chain fatty acids transporter